MVFIFDAKGNLCNSVPERVYEGSNEANTIVVLAPWTAGTQVYASYQLPNSLYSEPVLMTSFDTAMFPIDFKANAWSLDIDEIITQSSGTVNFQFFAITAGKIAPKADISVSGSVALTATVNASVFATQISESGEYNFTTNGGESASWYLGGNIVNLADYGITITSTVAPAENSALLVKFMAGSVQKQATAKVSVPINEGNEVILPDAPTQTIYDQILAAMERVEASVLEIKSEVDAKQDKTDNGINLSQFPTQKTVVGAINDIGGQVKTNTADIGSNAGDISALDNRVTNLENTAAGAETPVGQLTGSALPTNDELTDFTVSKLGRQPKPNDSIIFVLEIAGQTNKNYKYIYYDATTRWQGYEIPPIEQASNGSLGTIKGTYGIGSTNNILVNISSGEIKGISYLDNNGIYQNIRTKINLIDVMQTSIVDGTQVVGISTKAIQDQLGNIINLTYAKQSDVYTKSESDSKYLPSTYTNIYYYSAEGLVDDIPTTPASGIQFTKTVNTVGTTNIFTVNRQLAGNYNFTKNSTDNSAIWVSANRNCTLEFRLTTNVKKSGESATLLSAELTGEIVLTADTPTLINIPAVYSALGSTEFKADAGDTFSKSLDVITTDSTATVINVYSNAVHPSSFNLSAQSLVFDVNTISGLKSINIAESDWVDNGDGTYSATIPQTRHQQAPSTNYMLDLQEMVAANTYERIVFSAKIDTSGNITLTAYEPLNCVLLIGSSIASEERGILTLTNPTTLPSIDYAQFGAMRVEQTETATALTLPTPTDVGKFATFFVSNSSTSANDIKINNEEISAGSGMQFKWNGSEWQIGEQPTDTDEVYDKAKSQLLSQTLSDMQIATNNADAQIQGLDNSKLDTDLGNVELQGLAEKVFDCKLNKYIYRETNSQTGVDLTSLEYDGQYGIILLFDFTADNETITQTIPQVLNSTIDIKIALQQGGTYHTGCKLILQPASGVQINGTGTPIELTADGYNGTLKPVTDGNWQFDKISEAPTLTITDGTISRETSTMVVDKQSSGLEVYAVQNQSNQTGIRIRPDFLAKTLPDNFYAKLNGTEYINLTNGISAIDGKIWGGDIEASESSYVYAEPSTKSVICQAVGDDSETAFTIKFVADFGDFEAQSDGYVSIYAQNNTTNTILTDDNGNPLGVKEYFKAGDKITRLVAYGVKTFSTMVKVGFVVENGFNEVLELTQDTCYSIQALQSGKQVSAGDNAFDIATGLRWQKQFRYYYSDLLKLDWLKNETVAEQTIPAGAYNYNDGLHLDVVNNPLKFAVGGGTIKLEDNGTDIMFCAFGRVFDRVDTANLKGKTLNIAFKGTNKNNAWNIRLLTYTGDNNGQFDTQIVTGISNDTISYAAGWVNVSQIFITEDVTGEHEVTGRLTIPTTTFDRMAILLIPVAQQSPNSIEIRDFNASLTNGFTERELILGTSVREDHLRYDSTYAKFQEDNQGYASIRYTINSGDTKLPFGYKVSGNGAVSLVKIWQDNASLKGEGGLNFTNKDEVTMRIKIPLHRGEGALAGQSETTTFAIYKRQAGTDAADIADPANFDITNFAEITGTSQDFVIPANETDTFYVNYITTFNLTQNNETIVLVGKTTHNTGSYISITPKMPLITDIQGIEIV